jgi:molybdate-binding protein
MAVLVKICGVTTPADARMVSAAGADMIGLNFYHQSKRFVDLAAAVEISTRKAPKELQGILHGCAGRPSAQAQSGTSQRPTSLCHSSIEHAPRGLH